MAETFTGTTDAGSGPARIERAVWALSVYGVPILVGLLSCLVLLFGLSPYRHGTPPLQPLVAVDPSLAQPVDPDDARRRLAGTAARTSWSTQRSEQPVWFGLAIPPAPPDEAARTLEFPSPYGTDLICWEGPELDLLGGATRSQGSRALFPRKGAFALTLNGASPAELVCRGSFAGPAHITAVLWSTPEYLRSVRSFDRNAALLDGATALMAAFLVVAAVVHRRALYLLFAVWLFLAMRVGGVPSGWDVMWLGQVVPADWLTRVRALSLGLYGVVLVTLHRALFREALAGSVFARLLRVAHRVTWLVALAACALPYRWFVPLVWSVGGAVLVLMCTSLWTIVQRSSSRVAFWYSGALAVALLAHLVEIVAVATGRQEFVDAFNGVTATLVSSLLACLAFAERMREEQLQGQAAHAHLQHMLDTAPVGLFTLDREGRIARANPALRRMLNLRGSGGNTTWAQQFGAEAWLRLRHIANRQDDGDALEVRWPMGSTRGAPEQRRFLVRATQADGRIEGSLQDVTDRSRTAENLQFLADHDPLTGLSNRRGIEQVLDRALQRLAQNGPPVSVAHLDLDRFQLVNDLFGHAAGDEVLKRVRDRIGHCLPDDMDVARIGADEFVVVMVGSDIRSARTIGETLVDSIGTVAYRVGDKTFPVHVSVGVVEVAPHHDVKTVLLAADRACRQAKARCRGNGLVCYDKDATVFREHAVELQLIEQIAGDHLDEHLSVVMQPIMSLVRPSDILNVEVLLRMRGTDGDAVPTPQLIQAAEATGRMAAIDRWVLDGTLAWMETHHDRLASMQFVCVNLSGASLNDKRFVEDVVQLLDARPVAARRICFEITESVALLDLDNTRQFITRIRRHGARVALDDFGAGYTSFAYLRELPADILKIDGKFVCDMNRQPANVAIVEAIVRLARNLGMQTIAEWAEDADTVRTLAGLGVDYVQGYAVAEPQSPDALPGAASAAAFATAGPIRAVVEDIEARNRSAGALAP